MMHLIFRSMIFNNLDDTYYFKLFARRAFQKYSKNLIITEKVFFGKNMIQKVIYYIKSFFFFFGNFFFPKINKMGETCVFTIGDKKIDFQLDISQVKWFSYEVANQLFHKKEYTIQSKVDPEIFQSFILHYTNKKKISEDDLSNIDNIYQYYFLIKEFDVNKDLFSDPKYEEKLKESMIKIL